MLKRPRWGGSWVGAQPGSNTIPSCGAGLRSRQKAARHPSTVMALLQAAVLPARSAACIVHSWAGLLILFLPALLVITRNKALVVFLDPLILQSRQCLTVRSIVLFDFQELSMQCGCWCLKCLSHTCLSVPPQPNQQQLFISNCRQQIPT